MEPHIPHPLPAGPTQEQDSTPEEVSSTHEREAASSAKTVSDHRTIDRFPPTDEEGIMDCWNRKVNNQLIECSISDSNVYEQTPEELAGTGYWWSEDAANKIHGPNGVCIGSKKCLASYEGRRPNGKRTIWRMLEYMPDKPPRERASEIQETSTPAEVVSGDVYRPDSQLATYHRIRDPDGEYDAVYLSPGFGFWPKDDILITDYLNKKINGEEAPYIRMIATINVYNHNPEELAESQQSLREDEWYFFSSRDRKYLNGKRPKRAAGNGYWKATGADKKIYRNEEFVGKRKCLVFYQGKTPNGKKTNWVMHEYVANQPRRQPQGLNDMRLDECVLCRIYKKSDESGKTEKSAAHKSFENQKQAAPRRMKREHQDSNIQQNRSQVLQSNPPTPQQNRRHVLQSNPPTPQQNRSQVLQPNPPTPQQNHLQVLQPNLLTPQHNRDHVLQPNPPTPQQNHRQVLQPNPPAPQPILRMPQQNPQTIQYGQQATGIPDPGQPDFLLESIQEDEMHFNFDDLFDIETFGDTMSIENVGNQASTSESQHWSPRDQHSNYLYPHPPFDCFEPKSPAPFGNNDHPPHGH